MNDRERPATFTSAYPELARIAHRAAYPILGTSVGAEDVAREALTRAYVRWRRVRSYAEPWVARVATNLAIAEWRRRRKHPPVMDDGAGDGDVLATLRIDLVRLLDRLPRRQREVLVLRYFADQSERSTARVLGCSVGMVKRHAHRGLTRLRAELDIDITGDDS